MENKTLARLALLGIGASLMFSGCQKKENGKNGYANGNGNGMGKLGAAENMSADMQSFFNSLSPESQKKFMEMDSRHRMMSMEMAHQECKGENACKGMGGCATSKNACAGKNSCKGQGGAPVHDPNKAVEAQYMHQMKMNRM